MTTISNLTIGFVGFGNMAEAIWKNGAANHILTTQNTYFCDASNSRTEMIRNQYKLTSLSLPELVEKSDLILFCIKPQSIQSVLESIQTISFEGKCIGSILAGTPIQTFESALGRSIGCIRIMPNTPLMIGHGMTAICANNATTDTILSFVKGLFSAAGDVQTVNESYFDCITALSGSGPAFFYRIVEAFSKEGVAQGLSYEQAIQFLSQTMIGAGNMIQQSGNNCEELIQQVKSPGGTTAAGLDVFDETGLDKHLRDVISNSIKRAQTLAKG